MGVRGAGGWGKCLWTMGFEGVGPVIPGRSGGAGTASSRPVPMRRKTLLVHLGTLWSAPIKNLHPHHHQSRRR